jgi:hypothetical protein
LKFKDLDRNSKLDPYEDWRLSAEGRAADLAQRMSLQELAGLMAHGTLPAEAEPGSIGSGKGYDLAKTRQMIEQKHANSFITRLNTDAQSFAHQSNEVQVIAESSRWGILDQVRLELRVERTDTDCGPCPDKAWSREIQAFPGLLRDSRMATSVRPLTSKGNHTGASQGSGIRNSTSPSLIDCGHRIVAQREA